MRIIYIIPPKVKRYFTLCINSLLLLFSVVNYFLHSYFNNIFLWKDLFLSGDGLSFVSSVYKYINIKLILFLVVSILFIVYIYKFSISYKFKMKKIQIIILIIMVMSIGFIYNYNKKSLTNIQDGWDSTSVLSNNANYYTNWLNSVNNLKISGTYEYIVRDLYFSFIKKDNVIEAKNNVNKYLEEHKIGEKKEQNYYGLFKDKNLIFVMLESMDDWMINENATPTIYEMMHHGFNFTNHYSPGYVTGETANTEFIANTGMYPSINKLSPNYAYVKNDYPYSIANLFKDSGYRVNSFHRSYGFVYNREKMHLTLGYNKYHNYETMGIADEFLDLDSKIIENGYNIIVSKEKFMSFIITYSPHSPYTYSKIECQTNLSDIKELYPDEDNEEILCALSAARETDNMFKLLLEKLERDNLLEDTIIVAFTDHPNYIVMFDDETRTLNKTAFYIYDSTMEENKINTITSSINILPTILNLWGLDTDYVYPGYDALNYDDGYVIFKDYNYYDGYVIFKDYNYYDGNSMKQIPEELYDELNYSSNVLISNYYKERK